MKRAIHHFAEKQLEALAKLSKKTGLPEAEHARRAFDQYFDTIGEKGGKRKGDPFPVTHLRPEMVVMIHTGAEISLGEYVTYMAYWAAGIWDRGGGKRKFPKEIEEIHTKMTDVTLEKFIKAKEKEAKENGE